MIHFHFQPYLDKAIDVCLSPTTVGTSVIAMVTLMNFQEWLKVGLLLITIGYSLWKWFREANPKKKE